MRRHGTARPRRDAPVVARHPRSVPPALPARGWRRATCRASAGLRRRQTEIAAPPPRNHAVAAAADDLAVHPFLPPPPRLVDRTARVYISRLVGTQSITNTPLPAVINHLFLSSKPMNWFAISRLRPEALRGLLTVGDGSCLLKANKKGKLREGPERWGNVKDGEDGHPDFFDFGGIHSFHMNFWPWIRFFLLYCPDSTVVLRLFL